MGERVEAARAETLRRSRREGRRLVPLRLAVTVIVVLVAATSTPSLGLSGRRLGLSICVVIFALAMLAWPLARLRGDTVLTFELVVLGGSAVAMAGLQPRGVAELPGSAVVFMAFLTLSPVIATTLGGAVTVGVIAALASAAGQSGASVAASALLCATLGATGGLLRRYRVAQERTELLLAELEEARDDQARAAATEERTRIARDLHDVLAHSLSGLSIQLEAARKIASGTEAPDELRAAVDRAAKLAKEGLVEAREAVGALRRDDLSLERLPELVEQFRRDLGLTVTYSVRGEPRPVDGEVGLTLYRVTSESLTNVVRHASGATTAVSLVFAKGEIRLEVTDGGGSPSALSAEGGGWGLVGLRERLKRLGGDLVAGPQGSGWSVVASVPT